MSFEPRWDARSADANAVRELTRATGFFRPDEIDVAEELVRERLERGDASGYSFVFFDADDGSLDGYACWGPVPMTSGSFDLYWIVVAPSAQGRGLGRRLLALAEARAREQGALRMYAETSGKPQYAPTRTFYARCGYQEAARLENFYAEGDDKLIFVRALAG